MQKLGWKVLYEWMVLQDLCHENHVNGMEIFYDTDRGLLVTVVEYCKFGSLAALIKA